MAGKMTGINGTVLEWARQRAGLSQNEVATAFKKDIMVIQSWEEGTDAPTYAQLEKLAYKLYKRPLATFFLPDPPVDKDPAPQFRLLPGVDQEQLDKDTHFSIRLMTARQEALRELNTNSPPMPHLKEQVSVTIQSNIEDATHKLRALLGIDLTTQYSWKNATEAMKHWRHVVESQGVFIFKRSFKQTGINGFCLDDPHFPVICINNSTSQTRQIFTLFHELAHLLFASNGFTKNDTSYINRLPPDARSIEVFCNRFAAEFLVPQTAFENHVSLFNGSDESIAEIAKKFSVSREVIMRRLLEMNRVSKTEYESKTHQWNQEWQNRSKGGGGNYYATQATYLGEKFIKLALSSFYAGKSSKEDLSAYFGVKVKQIPQLENFVLGA